MLEIAFDSRSLRQICESAVIGNRKLGLKIATQLRRRLADMRAAICVKDLLVGHPRVIEDINMQVELCDGVYIIFCANHNNIPRSKSGNVDWLSVRRIKVLSIERSDNGEDGF